MTKLTFNNVDMRGEIPVLKSDLEILKIDNLITGNKLGSNASQALFTALIESDPGFTALLNTTMSKQLRAMRDASAGGENVPIIDKDSDGNFVLKNIPKMSFSPMTSNPDDCCVVGGDLQVCQDDTILKSLCIEKCETGMERMIGDVTRTNTNSIVYAAYKQMLIGGGVPKASLPTLAQFEQLSLIAQFILLNMLTFMNGLLEAERNGNIIKRFSGLAQVYANPDVVSIDGGQGVIESFQEVLCRMNVAPSRFFAGGFFLVSRFAMSAVQKAVVKNKDGNYPDGWSVTETTETVNGYSVPTKNYSFNGLPLIMSELVYVDAETFTGDIYLVPPTVGIYSGVPLDMSPQFILNEWERKDSPFVHFDEQSKAYPDCWTSCDRLTNFGAVVSTEVNGLLKITNLDAPCDASAYKGFEGLININSYAPYIA